MLVLLSVIEVGCADYTQTTAATNSISDVRVTTSRGEVGDCRPLGRVDSRDTARGCGLTVQPTPEECLKYQVRRAGGDTLLRGGPVGDAYDCSKPNATPPESPRATPPTSTPPPQHAAAPPPKGRVRIVRSRDMAKGCVYLDDVDLKTACAEELGKTSEDCVSDRAIEAGGNMVFLDAGRAQIFSCKAMP
ncbi:MAG: hypothetical protein WAU32_03795 [Thermoanaerobaculia bacterium]